MGGCVGFIGVGEAAVTPAGVALADGVAESCCGAGVTMSAIPPIR
jgi:hypothetical protein